ncbi:alpha/beta hydrolase family protein [Gracilimonas sp.]|uniref:alpha/beta hydrolase family protein n=1 Tax=Gracilimonas sp. TaxID=1974203 RepID=UPI003BAA4434
MKKFITLVTFLMVAVNGIQAQQTIVGEWNGAIIIQGQQLGVIFHIDRDSGDYSGTLDIPMQGAMGLPLTRVEQKSDSVFFTFFAGQANGEFKGTFSSDSLITGTYSQGPASFPFEIKKQQSSGESKVEPGLGEDLIIQGDEVEIGGTLVYPDGVKNAPLVILISGSSAQNRDSNIFEFKIFAEVADHLKGQGIASFRYDDRQVGESTGNFMNTTLDMLAGDVESIIDYLAEMKSHSFSDIILLGHSQGGVVAGKVASENNEVDQLILMASTGVPLKDILRFQVREGFGEGIHDEKDIEKEISLREKMMAAIRDGKELDSVKSKYVNHYKSMLENLSEQQKSRIPDIDSFAQQQVQQLVAYYSTPQLQSLLFYDPAEDLSELEIPVLVLFGEKDTQVTEQMNSVPITNALDNAGVKYEVEVIADANHLFQKANTGQVSEYPMLDKKFVDGFLTTISNWIHQK